MEAGGHLHQEPAAAEEMATELVVSVATVERHITHIYGKLGVRGRAEATAYALRHDLDITPA